MWASITVLLSSLLPLLIKLILFIIEKRQDNDKLREEMLKLIANIEKDVPVRLHDKYKDQVERIKAQLKQDTSNV